MNKTCPLCRSYNIIQEGSLGQRIHLRCADCGTWFSRKSPKGKSKDRRAERKAKEQLQTIEIE